jgi:hypothetical protein
MSWCRLICKPWAQHCPHIADEGTANRTTRHTWERDSWSRKFAGISVTNPLVM